MRFNWRAVLSIVLLLILTFVVAIADAFVFEWHTWAGWTLSSILLIAFLIYAGFDLAD